MKLNPGDRIWVMDDNGSAGWTGRVVRVHSDAAEIRYAGYTEIFRLPDGRRGSRYLRTDQEATPGTGMRSRKSLAELVSTPVAEPASALGRMRAASREIDRCNAEEAEAGRRHQEARVRTAAALSLYIRLGAEFRAESRRQRAESARAHEEWLRGLPSRSNQDQEEQS